jgi:hypothetical protein
MNLRNILTANAIVSCGFGIISLLTPAQVMRLYGVEPNPAISQLAQYSGLGSFALVIVPWSSRNMKLSQAQKTIIPAVLIYNVIGIFISVLGALSGTIHLGWVIAGLYIIFSVCYAWFLFINIIFSFCKQ